MPKLSTARTLLWSFLEQASSKLVALVAQIVMARLLTPADFGTLAILLVGINIADALAQSGLGSGLIQQEKVDDDSYTTAFWLSLGIAGVLFIILVLLAPIIESFYEIHNLSLYMRALSIVIFFNSINSIQRSYLQRRMDFRSLFKVNLAAVLLASAVGVGCALAGFGIWALIAQVLVQGAATLLVMSLIVPWRPRLSFRPAEAKRLFSYGWKIAATSILGVLYLGVSELVLGKTSSSRDLGLYSQGRKYPMAAIGVATNAIQNVMFPAFAQKQNDREGFRHIASNSLILGTFIIAPITICLAVVAKPLISLLLSDAWLPSVLIFQIVCISHSTLMMTLMNLRAYMALGRSDLYLKLQTVKVLLGGMLISCTALVTGDIYLTAMATGAITIFNTLFIDPLYAHSLFGFATKSQIIAILPSLALAVISALVASSVSFFLQDDLSLMVVQVFVYAAVYLILARLFKVRAFQQSQEFVGAFMAQRKTK